MEKEEAQKNTTMEQKSDTAPAATAPATEAVSKDAPADKASGTPETKTGAAQNQNQRGGQGRKRNARKMRRGGRRDDRQRSEFDQKIVDIRRVTRVMAGGRRFSFSVSIVIGNKKGKVGVGVGKAGDTQLAIEKAARNARKHIIEVPLNKEMHIPHDVHTKYASSEVMITPAPGRGLVAGSSVRTVLELAGVKDVTAKLFSRSKNSLNNARATVKALKQLKA